MLKFQDEIKKTKETSNIRCTRHANRAANSQVVSLFWVALSRKYLCKPAGRVSFSVIESVKNFV